MRSPIYTANAQRAEYNDNTPTMTDQAGANETDINVIVKRHADTGLWSHVNPNAPQAGDFTQFGDATHFHAARNHIAAATEAFQALPAHVRQRFSNDPAQLLDFVAKEENQEEAIRLGLATLS